MPSARAHAELQVPIADAWALLTDFPRYGEWNPFIFRVDGPAGVLSHDSEFRLHVRWQDGKGGATSLERVTVLQPPTEGPGGEQRAVLAYRYIDTLGRLGLLHATRTHTLTQEPAQPTRYETEEVFSGLLSPFLPMKKVQAGFDAQTSAMKTRLEARSGDAA